MSPENLRDEALARLKHRKGLKKQLKTYVITNLTLIVIWAMSGQGDFWPAWSIVFWGLALGVIRPGPLIILRKRSATKTLNVK